jgi:hypothetical protein
VFCRLASQSGRFDKINRQKCNLTPRLQREDKAATFYPSKVKIKANVVLLRLVLKQLGLVDRLVGFANLKSLKDFKGITSSSKVSRLVPWVNGVKRSEANGLEGVQT